RAGEAHVRRAAPRRGEPRTHRPDDRPLDVARGARAGEPVRRPRPGRAEGRWTVMATATTAGRPRTPAGPTAEIDRRALARELARDIRGEVRFSPGSRAL